ncbi:MAG: tetratricopeptide repeat protein, partial [Asgard group archaeon]|nr:tetratricopeptide repeat protein [Asgard group archaeon]
MSSTIQKQLEEVEKNIIQGNFLYCFEIIEKNIKQKNISKEDQYKFLALKTFILNQYGEYQEALEITEKVFTDKTVKENLELYLDILNENVLSLAFLGKIQEALTKFDIIDEILTNSKIKEKVIYKQKALFNRAKWWFHFTLGDREKFIHHAHEFNNYSIKYGNKFHIATSYNILAFIYSDDVPNLELCKEYLDSSYEIIKEIGNKFELTRYHLWYGVYCFAKYEYNLALESFQKGIDLALENKYNLQLPILYLYKGAIHRRLLELDKALDLTTKSLKFPTTISWQIYPTSSIGYIYHLKGELSLALDYYKKSLKKCQEINEKRHRSYLLTNIVELCLELDDTEKANEYLNELDEFNKTIQNDITYEHFTLAKALVLKASNQIRDLSKAADLLEELLKQEEIRNPLEITFNLITINLKELQLSPNEVNLGKVNNQINNLQEMAERQHYTFLRIEIFQLKSQLALIESDAEKALEYLMTAKTLASEKGSTLQVENIVLEIEQLNKQLDMWKQLQAKSSPLTETIKQITLDKTINRISKETIIEERDENT